MIRPLGVARPRPALGPLPEPRLAGIAVLVTVPMGVALAIGLTRWRGRGAGSANFVSMIPLVTPEIVMGTALLSSSSIC